MSLFDETVDMSRFFQSQLLPSVYKLNVVVDAFKPEVILKGCMLSDKNMIGVVIDEKYAIDIDTEFDLEFCEFLLSRKKAAIYDT